MEKFNALIESTQAEFFWTWSLQAKKFDMNSKVNSKKGILIQNSMQKEEV